MNKMDYNALVETIRSLHITEADPDDKEFGLGYTEGQNDLLDRVVDILDDYYYIPGEAEHHNACVAQLDWIMDQNIIDLDPLGLWGQRLS